MKVVKFGGSSVADVKQFRKVKAIIQADNRRQVVVVSAIGKSLQQPIKMTDMLIELERARDLGEDINEIFESISERFLKIRDDLKIGLVLEKDLLEIKDNLFTCSHDYLISRGEYLTAKLMAKYLGYKFVDASLVMIFKENGFDYGASKRALLKIRSKYQNIVVPGFYGVQIDKSIQLMARGGSDISGAILANLLDAKLYENWTDVSGILMADPRIVDHSQKIDILSYEELQELSYMGIGVFQEEAILPVRKKQISTKILNTNDPKASGTLVVGSIDRQIEKRIITGIAGKKNYTVITIKKYQLNRHIEILQQVLSILQKHHIVASYVPSGNDGFSFLCQQDSSNPNLESAISNLRNSCNLDKIIINKNIALVAAVSWQLSQRPSLAGKILDFLDNSRINVKLVIQEGSNMKVIFGVNDADYERTIVKIYQEAEFYKLSKPA
ncbi:aspartate kinase [Companilactobacillus alimentarius]